jgi:hypothetical protein
LLDQAKKNVMPPKPKVDVKPVVKKAAVKKAVKSKPAAKVVSKVTKPSAIDELLAQGKKAKAIKNKI